MNITITGRHMNLSNRMREHAEKKVNKLENHFNQIIDARVIMAVQKLDHVVEVVINGDGVQFHGKEKAADLYSAIDLLIDKMEKQIKRYKERHQEHKGLSKDSIATMGLTSNRGDELRLNQVSNKPLDQIEAYLQLKLLNSDFILFKKGINKIDIDDASIDRDYAVMFRNSSCVKMIEMHAEKHAAPDHMVEYELKIIDESMNNPNIEFNKARQCSMKKLSMDDALAELEKSKSAYLPFFNTDSHFINVIYKNGKSYEVMVPAF